MKKLSLLFCTYLLTIGVANVTLSPGAFASAEMPSIVLNNESKTDTDTVTINTRIARIEKIGASENFQLFLLDGRIATLAQPNNEDVRKLKNAVEEKSLVSFNIRSADHSIVSFATTESSSEIYEESELDKQLSTPRNPETFVQFDSVNLDKIINRQTMEKAFARQHESFVGLRRFIRTGPSQCFRRAHVWAYEMEKDFNIESNKVFLMYGRRCMNGWWFHVAPYVHMRDESGNVLEMVMDKEFFNHPAEMNNWTRKFVPEQCKVLSANQYNIYEREKRSECCHIIKAPRFYFLPDDLDEVTSNPRNAVTGWNSLSNAYIEYYPSSGRRF
ncbi:MAG: hypothetical protein HQK53_01820 [Oligoflexia bacterium]|nr:hypothetical protein [Oligoflexia bacterium]